MLDQQTKPTSGFGKPRWIQKTIEKDKDMTMKPSSPKKLISNNLPPIDITITKNDELKETKPKLSAQAPAFVPRSFQIKEQLSEKLKEWEHYYTIHLSSTAAAQALQARIAARANKHQNLINNAKPIASMSSNQSSVSSFSNPPSSTPSSSTSTPPPTQFSSSPVHSYAVLGTEFISNWKDDSSEVSYPSDESYDSSYNNSDDDWSDDDWACHDKTRSSFVAPIKTHPNTFKVDNLVSIELKGPRWIKTDETQLDTLVIMKFIPVYPIQWPNTELIITKEDNPTNGSLITYMAMCIRNFKLTLQHLTIQDINSLWFNGIRSLRCICQVIQYEMEYVMDVVVWCTNTSIYSLQLMALKQNYELNELSKLLLDCRILSAHTFWFPWLNIMNKIVQIQRLWRKKTLKNKQLST